MKGMKWLVLGAGLGVIAGLLVAASLLRAWRVARTTPRSPSPRGFYGPDASRDDPARSGETG